MHQTNNYYMLRNWQPNKLLLIFSFSSNHFLVQLFTNSLKYFTVVIVRKPYWIGYYEGGYRFTRVKTSHQQNHLRTKLSESETTKIYLYILTLPRDSAMVFRRTTSLYKSSEQLQTHAHVQ